MSSACFASTSASASGLPRNLRRVKLRLGQDSRVLSFHQLAVESGESFDDGVLVGVK